ncbi:MAG: hypothetical protein ACOCWJ_04655 [Verrucomicrobiota bacterium]
MNILTVILMLAAAAVMVFGLKKSKQGVEWGKPVTVAGAVIALLLALSSLFTGGGPSAEKVREIAERYREVRGQKLGRYLSEQFDGQRAVFLMPYEPIEMKDPHVDVFMKALNKELDNSIEILDRLVPEPPPEVKEQAEEMRKQMEKMESAGDDMSYPPEEMMYGIEPTSEWFTAEKLDEMLEEYVGEADLLIAISEMPIDIFDADFWRKSDAPKVVLTRGSVSEYYGAIKAGAVVAAVAYHPDANYDQEKPPKNVDEAFAQRYLLITPENVDELDDEYSKLFNKKDK